jgi:IS30 family transposase
MKNEPEWWAEARRLHAEGLNYRQIGKRLGKAGESVHGAIDREWAKARTKKHCGKMQYAPRNGEPEWWSKARRLRWKSGWDPETKTHIKVKRSYAEIGEMLGVTKAAVHYAINGKKRHRQRKREKELWHSSEEHRLYQQWQRKLRRNGIYKRSPMKQAA